MKYRTIKRKTYNNVMYLAKVINREKGYPIKQAVNIALAQFFDFDNSFQWLTVGLFLNNLVDYNESLIRQKMHEKNLDGIY